MFIKEAAFCAYEFDPVSAAATALYTMPWAADANMETPGIVRTSGLRFPSLTTYLHVVHADMGFVSFNFTATTLNSLALGGKLFVGDGVQFCCCLCVGFGFPFPFVCVGFAFGALVDVFRAFAAAPSVPVMTLASVLDASEPSRFVGSPSGMVMEGASGSASAESFAFSSRRSISEWHSRCRTRFIILR